MKVHLMSIGKLLNNRLKRCAYIIFSWGVGDSERLTRNASLSGSEVRDERWPIIKSASKMFSITGFSLGKLGSPLESIPCPSQAGSGWPQVSQGHAQQPSLEDKRRNHANIQ